MQFFSHPLPSITALPITLSSSQLDLPSHPPTINNQHMAAHVTTRFTGQIHSRPLEIFRTSPLQHRRRKEGITLASMLPLTVHTAVQLRKERMNERNELTLPAGILSLILLNRPSSFNSASFISVSIYPGAIALTVIPSLVHSFAKLLVSCPTAPLLAAYAGTVSPPWNVRREAKLITDPFRSVTGCGSRPNMCAPTSRHSVKTVLRLTCITSAKSESGNKWEGCRRWMPAQFTRMRMVWLSERMRGISWETSVGEERSAL